jgi:putative iron-regulated protein
MKHHVPTLCSIPLLALCALSCGSDDDGPKEVPANAADALSNYADIVYASYTDSLETAQALDAAITSFVAAPTAEGLEAARNAWLAAREPYLQTEVYRFYDGPIDNPDDGPEGFINAWPLDENYIDYVAGPNGETEGIINNPQMPITEESILEANEGIDEKSISTGYHAIEFLLWGQDFNDDGPGDRPFTDYVTDGTGTASNQDRRGEYLTVVSALLLDDLQTLVDAWAPDDDGNYRAQFLAEAPDSAFTKVMSGLIILTGFETGTERLVAALRANDQEEEHSCFSDNTHRDMVQDVQGMQNVWEGSYGAISGPGLRDVVAEGDATLADQITAQIAESLSLAEDLRAPFDQEIAEDNAEGNARVQALAQALFDQRVLLEEAFELFGLTRIPDPTP